MGRMIQSQAKASKLGQDRGQKKRSNAGSGPWGQSSALPSEAPSASSASAPPAAPAGPWERLAASLRRRAASSFFRRFAARFAVFASCGGPDKYMKPTHKNEGARCGVTKGNRKTDVQPPVQTTTEEGGSVVGRVERGGPPPPFASAAAPRSPGPSSPPRRAGRCPPAASAPHPETRDVDLLSAIHGCHRYVRS